MYLGSKKTVQFGGVSSIYTSGSDWLNPEFYLTGFQIRNPTVEEKIILNSAVLEIFGLEIDDNLNIINSDSKSVHYNNRIKSCIKFYAIKKGFYCRHTKSIRFYPFFDQKFSPICDKHEMLLKAPLYKTLIVNVPLGRTDKTQRINKNGNAVVDGKYKKMKLDVLPIAKVLDKTKDSQSFYQDLKMKSIDNGQFDLGKKYISSVSKMEKLKKQLSQRFSKEMNNKFKKHFGVKDKLLHLLPNSTLAKDDPAVIKVLKHFYDHHPIQYLQSALIYKEYTKHNSKNISKRNFVSQNRFVPVHETDNTTLLYSYISRLQLLNNYSLSFIRLTIENALINNRLKRNNLYIPSNLLLNFKILSDMNTCENPF
jgi:hypothetical protein